MDNNTDESNCIMTQWYHNASDTRCNRAWNLVDGRDEIGCFPFLYQAMGCNRTQHMCFDPQTGYPKCLSISKANDDVINCLGSVDERQFCRIHYQDNLMRRYRCRNSDLCISPIQVCDCHQDCPENDDETTACKWLSNGKESSCEIDLFRCRDGSVRNHISRCDNNFHCSDGEDEIFCELIDRTFVESINLMHFPSYPEQRSEKIIASQIGQSRSLLDDSILWRCNRGIHIRSSINPPGFYCFCQDQYYGDRCQFQRRRLVFILQLRIMGSIDHLDPLSSFFKVVILLVRNDYNGSIISYEQVIYKPLFDCLPRYIIYLPYPITKSSLLYNHSVFIHVFTFQQLEHRMSWNFSVPFEFLPVNRIAKRLIIPDTVKVSETMQITFKNSRCSSCSNESLCLGKDSQLNRDICVCPVGRIGSRCLIPFDPCTPAICSGNGRCIPINELESGRYETFECLCDIEWVGKRCESRAPRIHVTFTKDTPIPASKIVFIHTFLQLVLGEPSHLVYFRRLHRGISNFTFFVKSSAEMPSLVFIQLYEDRDQFEYYLLVLCATYSCNKFNEIDTKIQSSNRCRHIRELLNPTVLAQRPLQRVKSYQSLCLENLHKGKRLPCFYDDQLMCLCNKINHTDCLNFKTTKYQCPLETCSGQGMCVQDHEICPTTSVCLCDPCSYGNICQFSMAGYTLSLDGIIGSYILSTATSILYQSSEVKWTIVLVCILVVFGLILNGLSTSTFIQEKVRKSGCDRYLLFSSLIGLVNMITLVCKIIFLFSQKQNNVSCSLIEFLLKWCPACCEWLNASVGIERAMAVTRKTRFQTAKSKSTAKWVILAVFILVGLISMPELIFRRIVNDTQDKQEWCVLTINADRPSFLTVYSTLNVSLFLLPIISNFVSSVIIIIGTLSSKRQATAQPTANKNVTGNLLLADIKKQIRKHKHILIAPAILGLLALPRLILTFIFVCNKVDRRPLLIVFSYLIGFLPSMSVVFAFILPSETYKAALLIIIKKILPKRMINRIFTR
ncbi:hypothetical protein I4U23_005196 [Adineta vaga]|nr:hypothetical protein I4U23_005196 [Adineta vaga]